MKRIILFMQAALLLCTLNSCIQDESLNAECDITGVDQTWYKQYAAATDDNPEGKDYWVGDAKINEDLHRVSFTVKLGTDRSSFAPKFNLTPGAWLTTKVDGADVDANGMARDFTLPQVYTSHSEDGKWTKDYTVSFNYPKPVEEMNFANYKMADKTKYYTWVETDESGNELDYWASGNGGYALVGIAKKAEDYPTAPFNDVERGPSVKLTTCRTGSFGDMVKMPIAAGSLFIGKFNSKIAMKLPREATAFGLQVLKGEPKRLEGWYKYKAGEVFTDKDKKVCPERRDTADIYAVVYEVDPNNFEALNGDDVLTSDRIVLMARIDNPGEPSQWTSFSEPFKPMNGKTFDPERMARYGYAIAVVATSSRQGAYFEGAIGSTLCINQMRVVYE